MAYHFGRRSLKRLVGVHPTLVSVAHQAIGCTAVDFCVLEGVRTIERQRLLVQKGASNTMDSRHIARISLNNPELGEVSHAIDLGAWVDGMVRWDWPLYYQIANAMKMAAMELDIMIEWGGDWKSIKDGPHYALPRSTHPV